MKEITPIHRFRDGEAVQGFYLCIEKHLRHTRTGGLYLDLLLRDRTGQIPAKVWDKVEEYTEKFSSGDPVAVKGIVDSYREKIQLTVTRINRASVQSYSRYGYDPALIIPTSQYDPNEMWKDVTEKIRSMKNKHLRKLAGRIYRDHKDRILVHPASVYMHHNYRSGYLEHILSMVKVGEMLSDHYSVDKDLVLAGILLHDIGKLREIDEGLESNYTDEGNFIGHIVLSRDIVRDEIKNLTNFPEEIQYKLEHMILAHQGKYEWQSPKRPAFPEAYLLHMIDDIDAKMNLMEKVISEDTEEGNWTSRQNIFRIPLYKKHDKK